MLCVNKDVSCREKVDNVNHEPQSFSRPATREAGLSLKQTRNATRGFLRFVTRDETTVALTC
jgi:hypothetical protein